MSVKQISVFVENSKGSLARITRLLSDNRIDLIALSIAETENYGILRCIVSDTETGTRVLKEAGYTVRVTDVLAVCVDDEPGGLARVLEYLSSEDISVDYIYSFVRSNGNYALVIFHLSDLTGGIRTLEKYHVRLLDEKQVRQL